MLFKKIAVTDIFTDPAQRMLRGREIVLIVFAFVSVFSAYRNAPNTKSTPSRWFPWCRLNICHRVLHTINLIIAPVINQLSKKLKG